MCELDLIFNFETLHACLAEMVVGGIVVETGLEKVVQGVRGQGRVVKRPTGLGMERGFAEGFSGMSVGIGMGGRGMWAGR